MAVRLPPQRTGFHCEFRQWPRIEGRNLNRQAEKCAKEELGLEKMRRILAESHAFPNGLPKISAHWRRFAVPSSKCGSLGMRGLIGTNYVFIDTNAGFIGTSPESIGMVAGFDGTGLESIGTVAGFDGTGSEFVGTDAGVIGTGAWAIGTGGGSSVRVRGQSVRVASPPLSAP